MTRKLLAGICSASLFKLIMSNSHSSSNQCGEFSKRVTSISCSSRGVASASKPAFVGLVQNAEIDSWSLWIILTGSDAFDEVWFIPVGSADKPSELTTKGLVASTSDKFVLRFPKIALIKISWTISCLIKKIQSLLAGPDVEPKNHLSLNASRILLKTYL